MVFENNGDEQEEMWIVPIGDDDVCVQKVLKRNTIEGVQYSKGEYRTNVVFYDRCGKRQYSVSRSLQDKFVSSAPLRMNLVLNGDTKVVRSLKCRNAFVGDSPVCGCTCWWCRT